MALRKRIRIKVKQSYGPAYAMLVSQSIARKNWTLWKRASSAEVLIAYTAKYAFFVHENLPNPPDQKNYTKPGSGPHYLSRAFEMTKGEMRKEFERQARVHSNQAKGFHPEAWMSADARKAAAQVAFDKSQELVPEDTGFLRESGMIYVEGEDSPGTRPETISEATFIDYNL